MINENARSAGEMGRQSRIALIALVVVALVSALVAGAMNAWISRRRSARPLAELVMPDARARRGDLDVEIDGHERKDEIGDMARAVQVFKENAIERLRLEARRSPAAPPPRPSASAPRPSARKAAEEQAEVVRRLGDGLKRLAAGDLTVRLGDGFSPKYAQIRDDFNEAIDKLKATIVAVVASAGRDPRPARSEISAASDDLSRRTEQQAASLEETAAALERDHRDGEESAEGAEHAREVVAAADADAKTERAWSCARRSRRWTDRQVVAADQPDHRRDRRDRVPDQPAGAQRRRRGGARGRRRPRLRGRRLRSARAGAALGRGGQGDQERSSRPRPRRSSRRQAGRARPARRWSASSPQVAEINAVVAEIAAGAQEQATGLGEVNAAINQMDQVTQQNAAMVEESTAASHSLFDKSADWRD